MVVWTAVALLFALGSLLFPRVYESTALLEFSEAGGAAGAKPEDAERSVRAVVEDSNQVRKLAGLEAPSPSPDELARVGQSIRLRTRSSRILELSYRAASPGTAQRGCDLLAKTVAARFPEARPPAPKEDPRAALDRATKELTDFVLAHPNVGASESSARTTTAHRSDPAANLLRQEKARLEALLAIPSTRSDNPYDDTPPVDTPALKKRLAEIRAALVEHQKVASTPRSNPDAQAADATWHRLVRAVTEAQKTAFTAHPDAVAPRLVVRVIEAASSSPDPVESWRGPVAFLGFVLGLVLGVLSVLFRVLTDKGGARSVPSGSPLVAVRVEPVAEAPQDEPSSDATAPRERAPSPRDVEIPKPPPVPSFGPGQTQIGIMDPAAFAVARANLPPPERLGVDTRRILQIDGSRAGADRARPHSSEPPAQISSPIPPSRPPAKVTSPMPPSKVTSSVPPRGTPLPPRPRPRMESRPPVEKTAPISSRRLDTSYSFVDKTARIVARRRSERSEPPASGPEPNAARRDTRVDEPLVTKPGWSSPSPPVETGLATVQKQTRSRPPDPEESELVAPQSAPPSWRVGPPVADAALKSQLLTLCEQLIAMAHQNQRCFVVGVTSDADLKSGKSRTAARLATMLAASRRARVLLMEGDFDYPAAHRLLAIEMPRGGGFSQQMRLRARTGRARPWVVVRCPDTLHVLGEGIVRSPGILFSQEFSDAVAELGRCYDVIIVDGPVSGIGADYRPLDAVTDGVVFVVESPAKLSEGLDRASRWFRRKELVAAIPAENPNESGALLEP